MIYTPAPPKQPLHRIGAAMLVFPNISLIEQPRQVRFCVR
jgi:hypothetical protein